MSDPTPSGDGALETVAAAPAAAAGPAATADAGTAANASGGPGQQDQDAGQAALARRVDELRFNIDRSMRYHQRRRAHYERCHRGIMLGVLLAGSAAVSPWAPTAVAFGAAVLGGIDLVCGPSVRACRHEGLFRDFSRLMAAMRLSPEPTEALVREWTVERIRIEADEPPTFDAVEADCWNETARAFGWTGKGLLEISRPVRLFMNWCRFEGRSFHLKPVESRS